MLKQCNANLQPKHLVWIKDQFRLHFSNFIQSLTFWGGERGGGGGVDGGHKQEQTKLNQKTGFKRHAIIEVKGLHPLSIWKTNCTILIRLDKLTASNLNLKILTGILSRTWIDQICKPYCKTSDIIRYKYRYEVSSSTSNSTKP